MRGQAEAIRAGDLCGMTEPSRMANVLESVTGSRYPVIGAIEQVMMEMGALRAIMSGSGPTIFGIFDDSTKAEACRKRLRRERPTARTFLTWPDTRGGKKQHEGQ